MAEHRFEKETDLCAAFINAVDHRIWIPYAESGGVDILLIRKTDGFQIGIQAKLRFNLDVVLQCLRGEYWPTSPGPDCKAILVPGYAADGGLGQITDYIGITIIRQDAQSTYGSKFSGFRPNLPEPKDRDWRDYWFEQCPAKRCYVPEYVPEAHLAGASAPITLTDWKIRAIKIAVTMEKRGHITREDFKHLGIDHRRWYAAQSGWLKLENGKMVAGAHMPKFKAQHPQVYKKIAAEFKKWSLPLLLK